MDMDVEGLDDNPWSLADLEDVDDFQGSVQDGSLISLMNAAAQEAGSATPHAGILDGHHAGSLELSSGMLGAVPNSDDFHLVDWGAGENMMVDGMTVARGKDANNVALDAAVVARLSGEASAAAGLAGTPIRTPRDVINQLGEEEAALRRVRGMIEKELLRLMNEESGLKELVRERERALLDAH